MATIDFSLLIPPPSPADRAKYQLAIDARNLYAEALQRGTTNKEGERVLEMMWQLTHALENTLDWIEYANRAFENQNKLLGLDELRNPWKP